MPAIRDPVDSFDLNQFQAALSDLLASDTFSRSPALGRLLSYLVERVIMGESATLKESVIGHELYGRPASYDPKLDSVVRVSANRLRARLEDHYRANPGVRNRIVLPKGSYVPLLVVAEEPPPTSSEVETQTPHIPEPPEPDQQEAREAPSQPSAGSHRSRFALILAAVLVLIAGVVLWKTTRPAAKLAADTDWSVRPFARFGGSQQFGAFSPDGTRLAFTSRSAHDNNKAVYIQAITSEEPHRIAAGLRPAWSPDGKRLAFLRPETAGKKLVVLYDLDGGKESVLAELQGLSPWLCEIPRLSWSRDGKSLYSTAGAGENAPCGLVAIDVASGHLRPVLPPATLLGDLDPVVSPDGTTIAFMRCLDIGALDLFLLNIQNGQLRRVTNDATDMLGFDWSSDSKALIVASIREGGTRKLWRISLEGDTTQALTDGSSAPTFPSVSPTGKEINFTQFHVTAPIWRTAGGKPVEVLENQSKNEKPAVSPDGKKMLYSSDRAGRWDVWLSNADGSESRPLLRGLPYTTGSARWSPDGRQIVMECQIAKETHICLSNSDGSGFHRLLAGNTSQIEPSWSHDGRYIYFTAHTSGEEEIYRAAIGDGVVQRMTYQGGVRGLESRDGQWLFIARGQPHGGLFALPIHGTQQDWRVAENNRLLEFNPNTGSAWDVCKDGVVYLASDNKTPQLDVFDMQTRRAKTLVTLGDLPPGTEPSVGALPDGSGVVFTTTTTTSELNIMSPR